MQESEGFESGGAAFMMAVKSGGDEQPPLAVAALYVVVVLASSLCVGFTGPFSGAGAVLAALLTAVLAYVVLSAIVLAPGLVRAWVSSARDRREFERDPAAFFAKRFPDEGHGSSR